MSDRVSWITVIGLWLFFNVLVIGFSVYAHTWLLVVPIAAVNLMYAILAAWKLILERSGV